MKSVTRLAVLLTIPVLLAAPSVASAACFAIGVSTGNVAIGVSWGSSCGSPILNVANNILYIINAILIPLLFAIAFIVFLYGVTAKYIFSHGDPERVAEGHKLILWGIIGFVVMVSLWGLVNVVANTFGLAGYYAPQPPSSIPGGGVYGI